MKLNTQKVIEIKNLSKTFTIKEKASSTLKERVKHLFDGPSNTKVLKAIQNLNLDIHKGEFFGVMGHNGSGKSTLLKLIIGAIQPDKGSIIKTKGKILRLALGMGFDPNLSARHNIYVNGSIMGLTFKEIGAQFDQIINFAGLPDYIDTPIKFFSSGMVSRLAFAIAMHVNTDILLIDEFFGGVGDINFKNKSEEVFRDRIITGKTIIFVSHDLSILSSFCTRILLLKNGQMDFLGDAQEAIDYYIASNKK